MASKTLFTLEDPYAEKVDDNYSNLLRTNKEIKNICAGKHSLCQWILLEHILVILSAWGTNDTYDQASPMVTTMRLVCTLLAEDKINIEKLAEMLIPSDETVSTSTKEELNELKQKATNAMNDKAKISEFSTAYKLLETKYDYLHKMILSCEAAASRDQRQQRKSFCVYELKAAGAFSDLKESEIKLIERTGLIPPDILNSAMTMINTVVSKKFEKGVLDKPRFQRADGTSKHGYEIYKLIQTPSDNNLRNVLHVSQEMTGLDRGNDSPHSYWLKLIQKSTAYDAIMSNLKVTFSFGHIMALAIFVSNLNENDVKEQSISNDIMKLDSEKSTIDDIATIIKNHKPVDVQDSKTPVNENLGYEGVTLSAVTAYYYAMRSGFTRKCFACDDSSHILANCPHNDKVDAFRRAKPDVYDKFKNHTLPKKQQQRKCRFGANCRKNKLGTCTFKHDPSDSAMPAEALKSTDDIIDNFGGISMMANTVDSENLIPIDITAPDYFVTPGGVTFENLGGIRTLAHQIELDFNFDDEHDTTNGTNKQEVMDHESKNHVKSDKRHNALLRTCPSQTSEQDNSRTNCGIITTFLSCLVLLFGDAFDITSSSVRNYKLEHLPYLNKANIGYSEGRWDINGRWVSSNGSGGNTSPTNSNSDTNATQLMDFLNAPISQVVNIIVWTWLIAITHTLPTMLTIARHITPVIFCLIAMTLSLYLGYCVAICARQFVMKITGGKPKPVIDDVCAYPCIAYHSGLPDHKVILDSGANMHMTGSSTGLTNLEHGEIDIATANGNIKCNKIGDQKLHLEFPQSSSVLNLKRVIHNPKLQGNLVSVYQICKESTQPTAVLFTKHGAWSCDTKHLKPLEKNFQPLARCTDKGTYICPTGKRSEEQSPSVNSTPISTSTLFGSADVIHDNKALTWHQRLGHVSLDTIKNMCDFKWITIPKTDLTHAQNQTIICKGCLLGACANHKHPRKTATARNANRPSEPGSEIHIDLFSMPKGSKAPRGMIAVDSATGWTWLFFLHTIRGKSKSATVVLQALTKLISIVKSDGYHIRKIYSDKESGVHSRAAQDLYTKNNIELRVTKASQQNLAETKIGKIRKIAKHMLLDRSLDNAFYDDAFRYATQISLLLPHSRLGGRTPYQEYKNKSNPIDQLKRVRTFGSICYFHNTQVTTAKHDPTRELIFVGFEKLGGPYIAVDPQKQGHFHNLSWHGIFDETYKSPDWLSKIRKGRLLPVPQIIPTVHTTLDSSPDTTDAVGYNDQEQRGPPQPPDSITVQQHTPPPHPKGRILPARESRGKHSVRYRDMPDPGKGLIGSSPNLVTATDTVESLQARLQQARLPLHNNSSLHAQALSSCAFVSESIHPNDTTSSFPKSEGVNAEKTSKTDNSSHPTLLKRCYPKAYKMKVPKTLKEAKASEYWPEFETAIKIENKNLSDHDTFRIIPDDPHKHKLGTKYVFDIKSDANGDVTRFKARLVAQGFSQIPDMEFGKTFAPVAFLSTILLLLVIAVTYGLKVKLLDFKGAFLHSLMPSEYPVFIKTPYGFNVGPNHMIKLNKSLYGTRNAGYLWWEDLKTELLSQGFIQSTHDPCLFSRTKDGYTTYLATWVDDVLVVSSDPNVEDLLKTLKRHKFDIQTFEDLTWYLGLDINHDAERGILTISQEAYIDTLLEKFSMTKCNPCDTPMVTEPPTKNDCSDVPIDKPYRQLLGALAHIARFSRPDILFAVFYLARYQKNPGEPHWKALKRVLRYLKGTKDLALTFRRGSHEKPLDLLCTFSDSDWAGDKDTRHSTTGYVVTLNNCPIRARSSKQKTTALSSCEAETIALTESVKDTLWIRNLLEELIDTKLKPTTVFCDNQSAVDIAQNNKGSDRCKHIAIKHSFLRENHGDTIEISKIPTKENISDIFTKPLPRKQFEYLRDRLFGISANPYTVTVAA